LQACVGGGGGACELHVEQEADGDILIRSKNGNVGLASNGSHGLKNGHKVGEGQAAQWRICPA
jgi:hypothetical protein